MGPVPDTAGCEVSQSCAVLIVRVGFQGGWLRSPGYLGVGVGLQMGWELGGPGSGIGLLSWGPMLA